MLKNKCVLLLNRFSYPPLSGYKLKTYNLIKILTKHYSLSIVLITDEFVDSQTIEFLSKNSSEYKIYSFPKWRFYWNALKTLIFSSKPLQVGYFDFDHLHKPIASMLQDADIIIPSLTRTTEYVLDVNFKGKKILDMVDSYALSYARSKEKTNSFFWKKIYEIESGRLHNYEKKLVSFFDTTIFVNREEVAYWNKYGNCKAVPNGVDDKLFDVSPSFNRSSPSIAFFGKMDYPPNVDAVKWYLDNVLPLLPDHITFYIVGISPSSEILKLAKKYNNVVVTGFIDNPYTLLSECLAIVAPMQTGGGIQNKVLEAMALGKPNILSTLAAMPIGGEHNKHFLIADTPDQHVSSVKQLMADIELMNYLGYNAKEYIKQNYSWQYYEKSLMNILG